MNNFLNKKLNVLASYFLPGQHKQLVHLASKNGWSKSTNTSLLGLSIEASLEAKAILSDL